MKAKLVLISLLTICMNAGATSAEPPGPCANPQPIFGKIIATCGDQMITYIGKERAEILGVKTVTSRFELAYCSEGGGRRALDLEVNSEGYCLSSSDPNEDESVKVISMWGMFVLETSNSGGLAKRTTCQKYTGTQPNVELVY